jgi:hypothetical protein
MGRFALSSLASSGDLLSMMPSPKMTMLLLLICIGVFCAGADFGATATDFSSASLQIRFAPCLTGSMFGLQKQMDSLVVGQSAGRFGYHLPPSWHAQLGL